MSDNTDTVHDISSLPRDRSALKKKIAIAAAASIAVIATVLVIDDYIASRNEKKDETSDDE